MEKVACTLQEMEDAAALPGGEASAEGTHVEPPKHAYRVDDSSKTFTRKLVEGQKAQYNFQLVVGDKDMPDKVSPRRREEEGMDKKDLEMPQMTISAVIDMFREMTEKHQ